MDDRVQVIIDELCNITIDEKSIGNWSSATIERE